MENDGAEKPVGLIPEDQLESVLAARGLGRQLQQAAAADGDATAAGPLRISGNATVWM